MQEQVGEEGLQPRRGEAAYRLAIDGQAELTEQTDLERSRQMSSQG
jgi:hypothetical protein